MGRPRPSERRCLDSPSRLNRFRRLLERLEHAFERSRRKPGSSRRHPRPISPRRRVRQELLGPRGASVPLPISPSAFLAALDEPFAIGSEQVRITSNIGIAERERPRWPRAQLRGVDLAMLFEAKASGGGCIRAAKASDGRSE